MFKTNGRVNQYKYVYWNDTTLKQQTCSSVNNVIPKFEQKHNLCNAIWQKDESPPHYGNIHSFLHEEFSQRLGALQYGKSGFQGPVTLHLVTIPCGHHNGGNVQKNILQCLPNKGYSRQEFETLNTTGEGSQQEILPYKESDDTPRI